VNWTLLTWFGISLVLLRFVERWIHRHLQGTMLLLIGDADMATILYALPLLPGVILHEVSHALAARLLGVRVGSISVQPARVEGRIRLGSVPVAKTDILRASLIGLAPLLTGTGVILLIGHWAFNMDAIRSAILAQDWRQAGQGVTSLLKAVDAWIWAYVIFTVSNTMTPSQADRQGWLGIALFVALITGLIWLVGLGPAIWANIATQLSLSLTWLATALSLTLIVDVPFVAAIMLMERILERIRRERVDYTTPTS
jgi:hypothetical protein